MNEAATADERLASIDGRRVSRPGRLSTEQPGTTPEDAVPGNPTHDEVMVCGCW